MCIYIDEVMSYTIWTCNYMVPKESLCTVYILPKYKKGGNNLPNVFAILHTVLMTNSA